MAHTGSVIVVLCLAAGGLCAASAYADDNAVTDRIQSAGRGAHLGHDLCGFTAAQIANYKANLKRSLSDPPSFDTEWDYGWQRATPTLLQYQSLKVGDPQDYESRVRLVCATLRRTGKRPLKTPDNSGQTKP
ncbi:hypothetical protein [Paraburkholderia sp.]|uniref:hypothetical protein n=1 Tax=Paraburkholderia sp. TaxID=1926495 RepID=UPI00262DEC8B|nr:hypothetical protein [Paraburkholderia sp.]